jgi:hypothetical protein
MGVACGEPAYKSRVIARQPPTSCGTRKGAVSDSPGETQEAAALSEGRRRHLRRKAGFAKSPSLDLERDTRMPFGTHYPDLSCQRRLTTFIQKRPTVPSLHGLRRGAGCAHSMPTADITGTNVSKATLSGNTSSLVLFINRAEVANGGATKRSLKSDLH